MVKAKKQTSLTTWDTIVYIPTTKTGFGLQCSILEFNNFLLTSNSKFLSLMHPLLWAHAKKIASYNCLLRNFVEYFGVGLVNLRKPWGGNFGFV